MRWLVCAAALLALAAGASTAAPAPAKAKKKSPHPSFVDELDCGGCHTPDGWGLSSTAGQAGGFDHDKTGFPLRQAHAVTPCTGCHGGKQQARPECASCHRDEHQGRLGTACAECHTAGDWRDTETLARHQRSRMPLTGRHALLDCTACHTRQGERAWSEVPADCFACHEKDYRRDIHPDHDGGDPGGPMLAPFPRQCGGCHRTTGWSPAVIVSAGVAVAGGVGGGAAAGVAAAGHDARFPISFGKHRGLACNDCHLSARPSKQQLACTGCHAHDQAALRRQHGKTATGAAAMACLLCHPGGVSR